MAKRTTEHVQDPRDLATGHKGAHEVTPETIANVTDQRHRKRPHARRLRWRRHYRNPFRDVHGLVPFRIDMGVDYGGSGPVYALGRGKVVRLETNSSWPGGHIIVYRLARGPLRGKLIFLAENLRFPKHLHVGSRVNARTKIAELLAPFPHCETGLSRDVAGFPPLAYGCYHEGQRTAAGDYMSDVLHLTGCPRGTTSGRPTVCPMPGGYPRVP